MIWCWKINRLYYLCHRIHADVYVHHHSQIKHTVNQGFGLVSMKSIIDRYNKSKADPRQELRNTTSEIKVFNKLWITNFQALMDASFIIIKMPDKLLHVLLLSKNVILIEVSWHKRQKWDNSLIFLYILACGSHVVRPNYHLSEPITKQDPPIPEGLAPIQMDRGSVSFKIKPLNLWAMDEGVRGMKLASNMISRVVPLRSFQSLEVKKKKKSVISSPDWTHSGPHSWFTGGFTLWISTRTRPVIYMV